MARKPKQDTVPDDAKVQETPASVATTTRTKPTMSDNNSILDFSEDVGTQDAPVPLPVGDYTAEIRAAARKTSASGNDYGSVTFYIDPSQYPADYTEGDPDGTTLIYNRVSVADTPPARYRLRKFLEAIGAKTGKSIDMNDWVGLSAVVKVDHETYEGETRAVAKSVVAS